MSTAAGKRERPRRRPFAVESLSLPNHVFHPKPGNQGKSPPSLLCDATHNDKHNRREYVVQVLMKVITRMTVVNAVNIMQESHYNGLSVVIVCGQADAEEHCTQLRGNGLPSLIEPASGGIDGVDFDLSNKARILSDSFRRSPTVDLDCDRN